MNDFEVIIGKMFADGKTVDEIVDSMAKSLDEAKAHKEQAEVKAKREKLIDHMHEVFLDSVNGNTLDFSDLAAGITLAYCKSPECEDLLDTEEKITKFYGSVCDIISQIPAIVRTRNGISDFFGMFEPAIKGKREKKQEKKVEKEKEESDWEKVQKFLQDIEKRIG